MDFNCNARTHYFYKLKRYFTQKSTRESILDFNARTASLPVPPNRVWFKKLGARTHSIRLKVFSRVAQIVILGFPSRGSGDEERKRGKGEGGDISPTSSKNGVFVLNMVKEGPNRV